MHEWMARKEEGSFPVTAQLLPSPLAVMTDRDAGATWVINLLVIRHLVNDYLFAQLSYFHLRSKTATHVTK